MTNLNKIVVWKLVLDYFWLIYIYFLINSFKWNQTKNFSLVWNQTKMVSVWEIPKWNILV